MQVYEFLASFSPVLHTWFILQECLMFTSVTLPGDASKSQITIILRLVLIAEYLNSQNGIIESFRPEKTSTIITSNH